MVKAALFDFDGTLYFTDEVNYAAYSAALAEFGFKIDHDYYCKECNGRNYRSFIPGLVENDEEIVEKVHTLKQQLYPKNLDKLVPNLPLFDLIEALKPTYKVAIVTTASRRNVLNALEINHKTDTFDLIVCGEDVTKYKPDPEGYNLAMQRLGALPENTIIFEDSSYGIAAGKASGATVFCVK